MAVPVAFAQQNDGAPFIQTDEAELFGTDDDELFDEDFITESEETDVDLASSLLVSQTVEIGGRYSFAVEATSGWSDPSTLPEKLWNPDTLQLSTSLSSAIFFDARPDEEFRVFGKMTVSYPFSTSAGDPGDPTDAPRELADVFHVEELFSDFNWDDRVFFRGGKQTMNWGVGYFFSPADLLSIAEVDPEDPDAEREGPVALRANVPFGANNAYAYLIPPRRNDPEPLDVAVAAKAEFVVGSGEVGVGGIYQGTTSRREIAPAAMITGSFSVGDVDAFVEGVASYGSNRTFVVASDGPLGVAAEERSDELFLNATGGLRYSYSPLESGSTFALIGQYLYNGEGYDDASVITDNASGVGALLAAGDLTQSDVTNTGRHYSAVRASAADLFGSGATLAVLWLHNYTDRSALVTPSLSRTFLDHFDLTLRVPIMIGEEGGEFAPRGNTVSVGLMASIGGGSF
jgi:hypothetical protein